MGWLRQLTGPGAVSGETGSGTPDVIDDELSMLLEAGGLPAFERQLRFAEIIEDRDWQLDQAAGELRMGTDQAYLARPLGSISAQSGTWLWAWADPSVDPARTGQAREAQAIGEARGTAALTTPGFPLRGPGLGHLLGMAISGLLDTDAYYRCPHETGEVYVLLDAPAVRTYPDAPMTRAFFTIARAVESMPLLLTKPGIAGYLRGHGLPVTETARVLRVADGTAATFRFDTQGRLTEIDGTLG